MDLVVAGAAAAADHGGAGRALDRGAGVVAGFDRRAVRGLDDRAQLRGADGSCFISLEPTESGPRSLAVRDWSATSEEVTEAVPEVARGQRLRGDVGGFDAVFGDLGGVDRVGGDLAGRNRVVAEIGGADRAVDDLRRADGVLADADREGAAGEGDEQRDAG